MVGIKTLDSYNDVFIIQIGDKILKKLPSMFCNSTQKNINCVDETMKKITVGEKIISRRSDDMDSDLEYDTSYLVGKYILINVLKNTTFGELIELKKIEDEEYQDIIWLPTNKKN